MFYLTDIYKSIQAKTASAPSADLKCVAIYNQIAMNLANVAIGMATQVTDIDDNDIDIIDPPVENQQRDVIQISIFNPNDESHSLTFYSYDSDTTTSTEIYSCTLLAQEKMVFVKGEGWNIYDKEGKKKDSLSSGFTVKDGANLDAFARFRVSPPQTIFDSKQLADKQPLIWDDVEASGTGTASSYTANNAQTSITVSNLTAGKRVRQTYRWFNYQPGKSQMVLMTFVMGVQGVGIRKRVGQFNDNNGIFLQQSVAGLAFVIRTYTGGSADDSSAVLQTNWNIDKLDGTGPSGKSLNMEKAQILFFDYEWLGVGRVRIGFVVDGVPIYCHEFRAFNLLTTVYMSSPNLPLRCEIENTGAGGAAAFKHICSTVISEGGLQEIGFPFGVNRGSTPLRTLNNANIYPLIALRMASGYFTSTIKILDFSLVCDSTAVFAYHLLLNPTVAGTALSWTALTNSSLEYDISRTNATTVSGGTTIFTGVDSQKTQGSSVNKILNSDFSFGSTVAGVSDIVVLGIQRLTGTTETFYGALNWKDQQ